MSRTIFVALCAVAIFAMAPFAIAEDDGVPPNPVTDAHRELVIGMTSTEWQPIVEKHLGWTRPEKFEYFGDESVERHVRWTWDLRIKCGPDEPQWSFHLDVVFVEDVIRSTMYFAEAGRGPREETKTGEAVPVAPRTQLDDAFAKLKKGMTEDEALAALKSCGVDWRPNRVLSYTIDLDDGNGKTHQASCKDMHWGEQHPSVVPDTPTAADYPNQHDYLLELHLHFADGKLYNADRMNWYKTRWNMLWRPPEVPKNK